MNNCIVCDDDDLHCNFCNKDAEMKVTNLQDSTYQVIKGESVLHQGSLSDCEAFIRLTENGYM